jgi:hypothetical protein
MAEVFQNAVPKSSSDWTEQRRLIDNAGMIGITPRQAVERVCAQRGQAAVVAGCVKLMRGDYRDVGFVVALVGDGALPVLDGNKRVDDRYWVRTWGARGLLWAFNGDRAAVAALRAGLADEHWRVREMAAKVVARYAIDAAFAEVVVCRDDPVPRVRAAAERAVAALTTG